MLRHSMTCSRRSAPMRLIPCARSTWVRSSQNQLQWRRFRCLCMCRTIGSHCGVRQVFLPITDQGSCSRSVLRWMLRRWDRMACLSHRPRAPSHHTEVSSRPSVHRYTTNVQVASRRGPRFPLVFTVRAGEPRLCNSGLRRIPVTVRSAAVRSSKVMRDRPFLVRCRIRFRTSFTLCHRPGSFWSKMLCRKFHA